MFFKNATIMLHTIHTTGSRFAKWLDLMLRTYFLNEHNLYLENNAEMIDITFLKNYWRPIKGNIWKKKKIFLIIGIISGVAAAKPNKSLFNVHNQNHVPGWFFFAAGLNIWLWTTDLQTSQRELPYLQWL